MHRSTPLSVRPNHMWADVARTVACVQVICVHAFAPIAGMGGDLPTRLVLQFLVVSFMACVPIFAMLTGALILGRDRSPGVVTYSIGKPAKIIAVTVIWELIYSIVANSLPGGNQFSLTASFARLLVGNPENSTLWYMYQLVGIYMIIPFMYLMLKSSNNRTNISFIMIGVTLSCAPVLINKLFGTKFWIPFPQNFFSLWPAYMLSGYLIVINTDFLRNNLSVIILVLLSSFMISIILNIIFIPNGMIFHQYEDFFMIAFSLSFFSLITLFGNVVKRGGAIAGVVGLIAPASFGIYLAHYPILRVVMFYIPPAGISLALLQAALTLVASSMVALALLRTPGLKQLVTV